MRGSIGCRARSALVAASASFLFALCVPGDIAAAGTQVSGSLTIAGADGTIGARITFSCLGQPACAGLQSATVQDRFCTNSFTFNDSFTVSGIDLSHPGSFSGTLDFGRDYDSAWPGAGPVRDHPLACAYSRNSDVFTIGYTGTWDGNKGTITATGFDFTGAVQIDGTFTANITKAAPVFPMEVTGSITPAVSNIGATFQPRPQDVGTNARVFVFALAPPSVLKDAFAPKDDPVACTLAQLDSSGRLVGATASTLQAYTSGVLTAQGQSVTILANVPTTNVAGATFFVGYGADANAMINTGVNRTAVTVPGAVTCAPQPPQTGWWWNPLEGGRGFSIEVQGNNLFFAAFHYEASGRATWNVSPGPISLGGSFFTSDLYSVAGGQTLGGPYHAANATRVGAITLAFSDASHGTMTWPGGTVPIERQNLVPGGLVAAKQASVPESGWWWNPQESGRGFFIEWQKGFADIAGYMYDDAGNPVWYIAVYETPNARAFSGSWWTFANGQSIGGTYRAATRTSDNFAPLTVTFSGPENAVMTLPNGRTTALTRQRF
jgi:hypothetical protein